MVLYYVTNSNFLNRTTVEPLLNACSGKNGERVIILLLTNALKNEKNEGNQNLLKQVLFLKYLTIKQLNEVVTSLGLTVYNAEVCDYIISQSIKNKGVKSVLNMQKKLIIKYYAMLTKLASEKNKKAICNIIKTSLLVKQMLEKIE